MKNSNIKKLIDTSLIFTNVSISYCYDEARQTEEVRTIVPVLKLISENLYEIKRFID